jgi:hypothetical protein
MYKPTYFKIEELLDPVTYTAALAALGPDRIFILFDDRVLLTADNIRKRFGTCVVNTWSWNGNNQYRGYRAPDCSIGATYSQHRFARALDMVPIKVTAEEIRQDIIAKPNGANYQYITAIELDISWLHFDVRNHNKNDLGLLTFKP